MKTDNETGEFWVEIKTGWPENNGWDRWAEVIGIRDAKDALDEIKGRGFQGRILDAEGSVLFNG